MTRHKSQEERRREILAAARRRLVIDGFSRTRLNDIAEDAGLSKGGVYFHFKSKREIFDALIDQDFERVMQGIQLVRTLKGKVSDKINFFAQGAFRAARADPTVAKFQVVMGEMALAHEDVKTRLKEIHEVFVVELKKKLAEGVETG